MRRLVLFQPEAISQPKGRPLRFARGDITFRLIRHYLFMPAEAPTHFLKPLVSFVSFVVHGLHSSSITPRRLHFFTSLAIIIHLVICS